MLGGKKLIREKKRYVIKLQAAPSDAICHGRSNGLADRTFQISRTQQRIKHTLTERWYAWEEAWKVAENDPEVNLNAEPDTTAYTPKTFEVCTDGL